MYALYKVSLLIQKCAVLGAPSTVRSVFIIPLDLKRRELAEISALEKFPLEFLPYRFQLETYARNFIFGHCLRDSLPNPSENHSKFDTDRTTFHGAARSRVNGSP